MVKDLFVSLAHDGMGVLLSTHSLDVAQELAHRIGILNKGVLVAEGTFGEIQQQTERGGSLEEVFLKITEEETTATLPGGEGSP